MARPILQQFPCPTPSPWSSALKARACGASLALIAMSSRDSPCPAGSQASTCRTPLRSRSTLRVQDSPRRFEDGGAVEGGAVARLSGAKSGAGFSLFSHGADVERESPDVASVDPGYDSHVKLSARSPGAGRAGGWADRCPLPPVARDIAAFRYLQGGRDSDRQQRWKFSTFSGTSIGRWNDFVSAVRRLAASAGKKGSGPQSVRG